MRSSVTQYSTLILVLGALAGCSMDKKPRLTGTVTLDGQPLADAEIQLAVTPNNRPTAVTGGWTDAEGKYEIRNVHPRAYKVVIRKFLKPDGTPTTRDDLMAITMSNGKGFKLVSPAQFADPLKTPLGVEVSGEKRQTADFGLTSTPQP